MLEVVEVRGGMTVLLCDQEIFMGERWLILMRVEESTDQPYLHNLRIEVSANSESDPQIMLLKVKEIVEQRARAPPMMHYQSSASPSRRLGPKTSETQPNLANLVSFESAFILTLL